MKRYIKSAKSAPKFVTVYVSQEYVPGYGWEDIAVYDDKSSNSYREAQQDVKDYMDNGFSARVIQRKVENPDYVQPTNELTYEDAVAWVESCPYNIEEVYSGDNKNYIISKPNKMPAAQVLINTDGSVSVYNISGNRTKKVYTVDELEKEVNRLINK